MSGASVSPELTQELHRFAAELADSPDLAAIFGSLTGGGAATIDGAIGSSCALTVAAIRCGFPGTLVVVCSQQDKVEAFLDDLEIFHREQPLRFPAWENAPGERLVYDDIYGDRLRTLKALLAGESPIVVCNIPSLLQAVPSPNAVRSNNLRLTVDQTFPADQLAAWLAERRFQAVSGVELPGEFARRGGIMDVFSADWNAPVRIEWFDDQIESMRRFDVASQCRVADLREVDITVLPSAGDDPMRASDGQHGLIDYLPADARFVMLEPGQIEAEAKSYLQRHPAPADSLRKTQQSIARRGYLDIWAFATGAHQVFWRAPFETVERFSGDLAKVRDELVSVSEGRHVYLVCQTEAEAERLTEIFAGSPLEQNDQLTFVEGQLSAGFAYPRDGAIILGGNELFCRTTRRRRIRKRLGKKIDSFLDLREGDLVVHLAHGIGRYRGLELLQRDNQMEEHLIVEFHGRTKLYVPVTKIELVQKYVGGGRARVRLATIGGKSWLARKKAAESAVQDMAVELLELQARRASRPGISHAPDSDWQREFDAAFPYEETSDQRGAIESIKGDMESSRPMDRLLCGDVGFGKTEVAIRAAFKAVDNGYQVAVMVPTTILAEQHYRTFHERMSEFPFQIAKLSRFCTTTQQREIVGGLAEGTIDVAIGTHRLASRDVTFQNLGLLIIDEEQRFGVEIKERLKALRSTVNILTMTATPIPRTLHMSLTGMRDISNLEVPPEDRIAVETRISRWDDELIRNAVLRELDRGGQVYFVHNRVHDIHQVLAKLERIVPEATIRVGHGQMAGHDLEEVMVDFVEGNFDVLLATTIVESGLDIPNANTIFIDAADNYGLADLHQLRGRVGRYKNRAFCYPLVDQHKHITPDAARRLRAIEEFSEMGAGFAIAMRDLEFRGAGNILGTQQSGHIAAVGYELYCQLLEAAVRRMKQLPPKLQIDVNVDLPGDAYVSDEYIPDLRMKIDVYRRISRVASVDDIAAIQEELRDRFGQLPPPTERLLSLASLRMDAAIWSIDGIRIEELDGTNYLLLEYSDRRRIERLAKQRGRQVRIADARTACVPISADEFGPAEVLRLAKSVLRVN